MTKAEKSVVRRLNKAGEAIANDIFEIPPFAQLERAVVRAAMARYGELVGMFPDYLERAKLDYQTLKSLALTRACARLAAERKREGKK